MKERVKIKSICTCAGFNQFKKYCNEAGIIYTDEFSDSHMKAYSELRGVGEMKLRIVAEKLKN